MNNKVVGFVGVGRMGGRMIRHVIGAGFAVHAFDIAPEALRGAVELGARPAGSAAELAGQCDVVISILPSTAAVETAVLGEGGIAEGIRPGAALVEMSTIAPSLAQRLAAAIEQRVADYLDCPVSGGIPAAEKGTLTAMAGGKPEVLDRCRDVLRPMTESIFHMGDVGAGLTAKLINQLMLMAQTVLVMEGLSIGARSGLDLSTLFELIGKSSANSWVWQNRVPRVLEGASDTWVTLDICHKDLGLARKMADEIGIPLYVANGAFEIFQTAIRMGLGQKDVAALGPMYEQMLGVKLRAPRS